MTGFGGGSMGAGSAIFGKGLGGTASGFFEEPPSIRPSPARITRMTAVPLTGVIHGLCLQHQDQAHQKLISSCDSSLGRYLTQPLPPSQLPSLSFFLGYNPPSCFLCPKFRLEPQSRQVIE